MKKKINNNKNSSKIEASGGGYFGYAFFYFPSPLFFFFLLTFGLWKISGQLSQSFTNQKITHGHEVKTNNPRTLIITATV